MSKLDEATRWIARRQAVWTRKLNKANAGLANMPPGVMAHIDLDKEKTAALRVLEELGNVKTILKEPNEGEE